MDLIIYLLGLFCLGLSAPLIRLAEIPPEQIGVLRFAGAFLILIPWALAKKDFRQLWARPQKQKVHFFWILLTAFFFFVHLWTFSFSAQNTSIAHCMILFSTAPLWTSLGGWLFYKEKPQRRWFFAYALALIGIEQLVHQEINFSSTSQLGDLMALSSAGLYAGYILCGKKSRQQTTNLTFTTSIYLLTGVFFAAALTFSSQDLSEVSSLSWLCILLIILLPTLLGHSLLSYLVKRMNVSLMTCGKLIEPAIASTFAYLVFKEGIGNKALLAFSLTAVSILILFLPWDRIIRNSRKI
jgi:drug/metabolite transporter (DMT)-like permease